MPQVPPCYHSTYFSHAFSGGYDANYYAYIWSEVLAADTAQWFRKQGGLKAASGERFRAMLLSKGGSIDAMTLFGDFIGHGPEIQPLLDRSEEHTSELQSLMRISYAVLCMKKKNT